MKHKSRQKGTKRNFKHLATAIAGAAMVSSMLLSPIASAATPNLSAPPVASSPAKPGNVKLTGSRLNSRIPQSDSVKLGLAKHEAAQKVAAKHNTAKQDTNAPENYKQVLDITATAYAPGPHDNDQWGSKTFLGTEIRPGIVAVDPNVIPLGSRLYIQYPDGHGEYAVAEDTGGAIKGNRIDIAKWTVDEASDFGIQHVKVFVVSSPKNA